MKKPKMNTDDVEELNKNIVISIVITVYQMEKYLEKCVDMLIDKISGDMEIILVDDGSTDGSAEICDRYADSSKSVRVVHKPNGGLESARRAGLKEVRGEYVTFIDADDWIDAEIYEGVLAIINKWQPEMVTFGRMREYGTFSSYNFPNVPQGYYTQKAFRNAVRQVFQNKLWHLPPIQNHMGVNVVKANHVRRIEKLIQSRGIINGEDTLRMMIMALMAIDIYVLRICPYHHRMRAGSMSHQSDNLNLAACVLMGNELVRILRKNTDFDEIIQAYITDSLYFSLAYMDAKYMFCSSQALRCFPDIMSGDRILLYGKGRFANEIVLYLDSFPVCDIVGSIDNESIQDIDKYSGCFEKVVVAIINGDDVMDAVEKLKGAGVSSDMISTIDRKQLTYEHLPEELKWK